MTDALHYVRMANAVGGRAEMIRYTFTLAERPWEDVLHRYEDAAEIGKKNPFRQFPYLVTSSGEVIPQSLAIMCHAASGTSAWPSDPALLTKALVVAQGAYDLYQAFGGFAADDLVAKKKFEERRAPQYFGALAAIYGERRFAIGETPTFADCIAREAIAWCVRRNEASKALLDGSEPLRAFIAHFDAVPSIAAFQAKQRAARELDPTV
ncbi:MAG: glutathione S-transferase [Deltaproteobacteria bacterium]|nr:glutathione S-transferase [Deltaproteobacteria bacterium]